METKARSKKNGGPEYRSKEYSYNVAWSAGDDAFVARVMEFPSLAAHGGTQDEALREIGNVVEFVLEDLATENEPIPPPIGSREYSGKLNVRLTKDLHRRLALESKLQGVSINALINSKLAR